MNLFDAMGVSGSGLHAQRVLIDAISMNLANVQTTHTDEGGPYRKRRAVLTQVGGGQSFSTILTSRADLVTGLNRTHPNHFPQVTPLPWNMNQNAGGVNAEVIQDPSGVKMVYDPSNPDANEEGYVALPNINSVEEMVQLMGAVRSYEANVTAFNAAKSMAMKALEIGR
jgi:flagellar basal-body rod protein FlgC